MGQPRSLQKNQDKKSEKRKMQELAININTAALQARSATRPSSAPSTTPPAPISAPIPKEKKTKVAPVNNVNEIKAIALTDDNKGPNQDNLRQVITHLIITLSGFEHTKDLRALQKSQALILQVAQSLKKSYSTKIKELDSIKKSFADAYKDLLPAQTVLPPESHISIPSLEKEIQEIIQLSQKFLPAAIDLLKEKLKFLVGQQYSSIMKQQGLLNKKIHQKTPTEPAEITAIPSHSSQPRNEFKNENSDDDVIEIMPPSPGVAREKKMATSGPFLLLDETIKAFNEILPYLHSRKDYLEQSKHLIRLAAHLVEETYSAKVMELNCLNKLPANILSMDDDLLHHSALLKAQIEDITQAGIQLVPIANYLVSQEFKRAIKMNAPSVQMYIVEDLIKLEAWLNKVTLANKTWEDYAAGPFNLKSIYSVSETPTPTTISKLPTSADVKKITAVPLSSSISILTDPYYQLETIIQAFNKLQEELVITTNPNPVNLQKHSEYLIKKTALLVENSYRVKIKELNIIKKLTRSILQQKKDLVNHHIVQLKNEIKKIIEAGKAYLPKAIELLKQDLIYQIQKPETPIFVRLSTRVYIKKLTNWLYEDRPQWASVTSPTPESTDRPLPLHPFTYISSTPSSTSMYASQHSTTLFHPLPPFQPHDQPTVVVGHLKTGKKMKKA